MDSEVRLDPDCFRRRPADESSIGTSLVYPNALPVIEVPAVAEENCIVFSGNLEYHPNIEAVRWFASAIWPAFTRAE